MKPLPKRATGKEALLLRRGVAARLRLVVETLPGKSKKSDAAGIMEIKRSRLSNWISEDDPNLPDVEPLIKLCNKTGCTLDYIFRDIEAGITQELASKLRERKAQIAASQPRPTEPRTPPLKVVVRR